MLRQPEQSHAFLICSDTILHLSLSFSPSHPRSFFLSTITLSILSASHSLIHTQQRHFTWDPQTSVSHLPLVPAPCTLCVYINVLGCLHVCELQSPLQCSCASGLHNLCHGQRGGGLHPLTFSHQQKAGLRWPLALTNMLSTVCKCLFMKLIALLRKSSGC